MSASVSDAAPRTKGPGKGKRGPNRITKHRMAAVERAIHGGKTPLQVIIEVMNGSTRYSPLQLKAAELAAPYVHPRLAQISAKFEHAGGVNLTVGNADPIEAARIYAQLVGDVGAVASGPPMIEHDPGDE